MTSRILSIQVGLPQVLTAVRAQDGEETEWESGIFKSPVEEARLGVSHLDGDGQADLKHHGGPDRAVLIYSAHHYPAWEQRLDRTLEYGSFGENLTVTDLTEDNVCLGDIWESNTITLEISQPRLPCFKLARRLATPGLNLEVMQNGKGGFYARTLRQGMVRQGDELRLAHRPHPTWTSRRAFETFVREKNDLAALTELAAIPQLSQLWKDGLSRKLT